ncbi:hypothetical protein OsI_27532 [Oryza sativa Indica Group]|uniref:Pentatricopeptide repeat-containing protein n=1 Tax=Oryza sativa subsp. indica TaxID=39946 RepID=B8BA41_ORYSI|nr:hypothetical protein OsI_27532 [Oryza sativa Indica Group]
MSRRVLSAPDGAKVSRFNLMKLQGRQEAAAAGTESHHAHHAFDELLHRPTTSSIVDLNRALSDAARHSPAVAISLFRRMVMVARPKVPPNLITYSVVIDCCSRVGHLDLAFAALGRVIRSGWTAEAITFSPLLKALCDKKRTSEAMDIALRRMPVLGCTPNVFSYTILLKGLCKVDDAMAQFGRLISEGLTPDAVVFRTLIHGLCARDKWDKAEELAVEMIGRGICPNNIFFSTLLNHLCKKEWLQEPKTYLT